MRSDEIESDGELLARLGTDGRAWAEEFGKTAIHVAAREEHEAGGDGSPTPTWEHLARLIADDDPGGWLHGWFANAIEAGRSAGAAELSALRSQVADIEAELEPLREPKWAKELREALGVPELEGRNAHWEYRRALLNAYHELPEVRAEVADLTEQNENLRARLACVEAVREELVAMDGPVHTPIDAQAVVLALGAALETPAAVDVPVQPQPERTKP